VVAAPALLRTSVTFRRFWTGQVASLVGDQITIIAPGPGPFRAGGAAGRRGVVPRLRGPAQADRPGGAADRAGGQAPPRRRGPLPVAAAAAAVVAGGHGHHQPVQLRLLRDLPLVRHAVARRGAGHARAGPRRGRGRRRDRLDGDRTGRPPDRDRARVRRRLRPVPRAAAARARGRWAETDGAGDAVPGGVRLRIRRHAAGHRGRLDLPGAGARPAAVPLPGRLHGGQLRVRPLGGLLGGWLGSTIGLRGALWVATAGALAGVLFLLPSPMPRLRDLPEPAE
jgi:hypothetical protein